MIAIRTAAAGDEAAVLALVEELFAPPARRPADYTPERGRAGFRHALANADADILLAVDGKQVIGYASVYKDYLAIRFGWRCWLADLVVTASRRSAGVGRLLLEASREWARAHGCTHLELSSAQARTAAHRFYLAHGMANTSQLFHREV